MTYSDFKHQIERVMNAYPESAIPDERMKIMWEEIKDLSGPWFYRFVTEWIGDRDKPFAMTQLREAAVTEREAQHRRDVELQALPGGGIEGTLIEAGKRTEDPTVKEFARLCFKTISQLKKIGIKQFREEAVPMIQQAANQMQKVCRYCAGSGYYFRETTYRVAYACRCPLGDKISKHRMFAPSDKERVNPISIQICPQEHWL